ncbi:hypothetical protein ColLi_12180 [Colletotrichum liriopes]|uniref:Uncharacterized protein n=1 Tax=Colletotrichum liriopes TaxID=708192 RepID=A0AA37GZV7_9PEZI|nr:hypothetical protein ColLi_12180 [Colletotrichum liriopes]
MADILGDIDENLSEEDVMKRKIDAINAWVVYAFICWPVRRATSKLKQEAAVTPPPEVEVPAGSGGP